MLRRAALTTFRAAAPCRAAPPTRALRAATHAARAHPAARAAPAVPLSTGEAARGGALHAAGAGCATRAAASAAAAPSAADDAEPGVDDATVADDEADLPTLAAALRALGARQPAVTFLLGGPGAGKGTLSERITAREGHAHASVGALLREASGRGTAEGRRMSAVMSRGGMVGTAESTALLLRHLLEQRGRTVVVDGYPRTFANAVMFDSLGLRPARVIAMEVSERVMRERLAGRGRRDDVPEIVRNRLVQFRAEWESIKEFYRRRGLLLELDADGDAEDVWARYLALPPPPGVDN